MANIGIAFYPLGKKLNPKIMLSRFLEKYGLHPKLISDYAGVIPCSGPIEKTYHDRLMVCGDSAGFVYAGTGEGIKYALKSGELAAENAIQALKDNKFGKLSMKRYEKAWKKSFGKEMKAGMMFFDLTVAGARLGKIKGLFSRPSEEHIKELVLEGKYSSHTWIAWTIARLMRWNKLSDKKVFGK